MKCNICQSPMSHFASSKVLNKYEIDYFQCTNCGFVKTEEPYWLDEAYSSPIAKSDVGLVRRNLSCSNLTRCLITHLFNREGRFLDYGCGYGLFVRLMRDSGLDFYGYDKFCDNLFYHGFEAKEDANEAYDLVTAFEVFEHFVEPQAELKNLLKFSKNILFSTELLPPNNPKPEEWWYYVPDEGQHISIYTSNSLALLAKNFDLNLYTLGSSFHLLTSEKISLDILNSALCEELEGSLIFKEVQFTLDEESEFKVTTKKSGNISTRIPNGSDNSPHLKIIIDGVFFQLYNTGIARVWRSLLEQWSITDFAKNIVVLDRGGTAPKIPGIEYRLVSRYDYSKTPIDREMLQQICNEQRADLFISSYYTTPVSTPSVFMAYDMIPEVLGADCHEPMWKEKHYAIEKASAYIAISHNTARDLAKLFPDILLPSITVAHCGISQEFEPADSQEVNGFKNKYGILKPYFLLVGIHNSYKNGSLFFNAFSKLATKQGFDVVCTGRNGLMLEPEFRSHTDGVIVHILQLEEHELRSAYSGAVALVYPSKYEGFGLPVLEALACGCPVITCPNASIPEVAGEAALYVNDQDVDGLANALCEVQKPEVRNSLIAAGLAQAKKFSWSSMANQVGSALINATLLNLNLREVNLIIFPNWAAAEEDLNLDLAKIIMALAHHPEPNQITLLINIDNIDEEDAALLLSGVVMNLFMEEDLDVTEGPEISLFGQLDAMQWSVLLPQLAGRIRIENENAEAIATLGLNSLPIYPLD